MSFQSPFKSEYTASVPVHQQTGPVCYCGLLQRHVVDVWRRYRAFKMAEIFFKIFLFSWIIILCLRRRLSRGAGSLHHLTLHQLSPTCSTLWHDWIWKKRQRRRIRTRSPAILTGHIVKSMWQSEINPICVSMMKEQDHGCSKE